MLKMASYTTLVNVHVETALKVSAVVARRLKSGGEKFEEDCRAAINAQNTSQFIKLVLANEGAIYELENDNGMSKTPIFCGVGVNRCLFATPLAEIFALFQALFSVIYTLSDDTKDTEDIIRFIATTTFANKDVKPHVRLNVGVILFNLIFSGESKSQVLNGKTRLE